MSQMLPCKLSWPFMASIFMTNRCHISNRFLGDVLVRGLLKTEEKVHFFDSKKARGILVFLFVSSENPQINCLKMANTCWFCFAKSQKRRQKTSVWDFQSYLVPDLLSGCWRFLALVRNPWSLEKMLVSKTPTPKTLLQTWAYWATSRTSIRSLGNEKCARSFFAQTFWTPPGVRDIPAKFPGHPRFLSSKPKEDKVSREGTKFSATTPSRGRPPPHRAVSGPKNLIFVLFFFARIIYSKTRGFRCCL